MAFKIGSIDFHDVTGGYFITAEVKRKITPKLIVRSNPWALVDNQVANVFNSICEWSVPIRILGRGANAAEAAADLADKIAAFNTVLTADPNPNVITDSLDYPDAPETLFQMVRSDPIVPGRQDLTERRHTYEDTITVRSKPFGSASAPITVDLDPNTMERIALFPLAGYSDDDPPVALPLEGDLPAPLVVSITGPPSTGLILNAIAAVCPTDAVLSDYDLGGEGGPFVGPETMVSMGVPRAGRFRALAYIWSGGAGARVGIGTDGASGPYSTVFVPSTGDQPALVDLGEFASTGSTTLILFVTKGTAYYAHVVVVPVDVSCVAAWNLGGLNAVTFASGANSSPGQTVGDGLVAPVAYPNLLVIVDVDNVLCTVDVSYTPLLWGWAS